jgi:hypothetical protein
MCEKEPIVKLHISESGIKPIFAYVASFLFVFLHTNIFLTHTNTLANRRYSDFLLHPAIPYFTSSIASSNLVSRTYASMTFKSSKTKVLDSSEKQIRFLQRTNIQKSALHTACHFGEWEVVGILADSIVGAEVIDSAERDKDHSYLVYSDKTRAEILRLCLLHVNYMGSMTPELSSYTAPTPDHKPAQSNDPSDLKGQHRFKEQKERGNAKLYVLKEISKTLSSIVKNETSANYKKNGGDGNKTPKMKRSHNAAEISHLMNLRRFKTSDELSEEVLDELSNRENKKKSTYDKLQIEDLKKMIDMCNSLIKDVKTDLLIYQTDHGACFGCFAFLCCVKIDEVDKASDIEKLKRWRYAECRRRLAPLK